MGRGREVRKSQPGGRGVRVEGSFLRGMDSRLRSASKKQLSPDINSVSRKMVVFDLPKSYARRKRDLLLLESRIGGSSWEGPLVVA